VALKIYQVTIFFFEFEDLNLIHKTECGFSQSSSVPTENAGID